MQEKKHNFLSHFQYMIWPKFPSFLEGWILANEMAQVMYKKVHLGTSPQPHHITG